MSDNYTTKTASLKAVTANVSDLDTKRLTANKIEANKILLNGQNITEVIEEVKNDSGKISPAKLVFRCELPNDKNWAIWNDQGDLLDINFSHKIVNGSEMFATKNIRSFNFDLSSLTNGSNMFSSCFNLTTFSSDLHNLTNGNMMFNSCHNLTTFSSDLSSLTNGTNMFDNCASLESFDSDLSSLTNCTDMFNNCTNLTTFNADLTSLENAGSIFRGCVNLSSFSGKLSSIYDAGNMFMDCKLNKESVKHIISELKQRTVITSSVAILSIKLGIDKSLKNDTDLHSALGITTGDTTFTYISSNDNTIEWRIEIIWN